MTSAHVRRFTHTWFYRHYPPERKGQRCRVLIRGRGPGPRNILVEFEDGVRIVRREVRAPPDP